MRVDGARKAEILETAAALFASRGVRTSLQEIADASGILPGSLYHHFESKEAIIIELIESYQADLDQIADRALDELNRPDARPAAERIVALATAIAACAVRHRAAVLLTFYEPPTAASEDFVRLARRTPTAIERAMFETLRAAQSSGHLRPNLDLRLVADRICQGMVHIGIGVSHQAPGAEQVPGLRCSILLNGLATEPPADAALNRSQALRAADRVIEALGERDDSAQSDKAALIAPSHEPNSRAEGTKRRLSETSPLPPASARELSIG